MTLNDYYSKIELKERLEGHSQQLPKQVELLTNLISNENILNVLEIGFNAGHSAELFLKTNPKINLISFDLGIHNYVKLGEKYIENKFPRRHKLIIGDSKITLPHFINKNPNMKYDLIFIDGGHDYNTVYSDFINCKKLSNKNTIIIMDDTIIDKKLCVGWNNGPNKVWSDAKKYNIIFEIGSEDYKLGRGCSWGRFNLTNLYYEENQGNSQEQKNIYTYFGEFYWYNTFILGYLDKYASNITTEPINILTFRDYAEILSIYFKDNPNINIVGKEKELYMSYRRGHHGQPNSGNENNFKIINEFGEVDIDSHLLHTNSWLENSSFYIKWRSENNLNEYGDSNDTEYNKPPLPDKSLKSEWSIYEYLLRKFPNRPWKKYVSNTSDKLYDLTNDLFNRDNKCTEMCPITKVLSYENTKKNNYIHIFPRNRGGHWNKGHPSHISKESWIKICKYLKATYPNRKICCHGHMESFQEDLKDYIDIRTENIKDSIKYFYKADILISPASGIVDLALNCGLKNIMYIYETKLCYWGCNPFSANKYYVNVLTEWNKFHNICKDLIFTKSDDKSNSNKSNSTNIEKSLENLKLFKENKVYTF